MWADLVIEQTQPCTAARTARLCERPPDYVRGCRLRSRPTPELYHDAQRMGEANDLRTRGAS